MSNKRSSFMMAAILACCVAIGSVAVGHANSALPAKPTPDVTRPQKTATPSVDKISNDASRRAELRKAQEQSGTVPPNTPQTKANGIGGARGGNNEKPPASATGATAPAVGGPAGGDNAPGENQSGPTTTVNPTPLEGTGTDQTAESGQRQLDDAVRQQIKQEANNAVVKKMESYDRTLLIMFGMCLGAAVASIAAMLFLVLDRNHVSSKIDSYFNRLTQFATSNDTQGISPEAQNNIIGALTSINEKVGQLNTRLGSGSIAGVSASQRSDQTHVYQRGVNRSGEPAEPKPSVVCASAVDIFNKYYPNVRIYEELKKQFSSIISVSCINLDDRWRPGGVLRFEESDRGNYIVVNDPGRGLLLLPRADSDLMSTTTLDGIFQRQRGGSATPSLARAASLQQTAPTQYQLVQPGLINV
jgi:hypothetical protein